MATTQYDYNIGQDKDAVVKTTGSAISSAVSLTFDLAVVNSKQDVLRALEILEQAIMEDTWPPA